MPARARRGFRASFGATGLAVLALAATSAPAAAAPSLRAAVADGTLHISGTPFAEKITLRANALDRDELQLDLGDDGTADALFDLRTFDAIEVDAGNGDDTVKLDTANGAFTTAKATRIFGGNGDDTLLGGSGNETFYGGRGNDTVDGNGGADTGFLGRGDDVFIWDPGDGSDVVEGQSGFDTMVFNGAGGNEIMAASAAFGRVEFTRSPGAIVMDLNDTEAIDVRALGGADSVTVTDLSGTDVQRVDVDLAAALGGSTADTAADIVTVAGTKNDDSIAVGAAGSTVDVRGLTPLVRVTHANPADDTLVIDPVTGDDVVSVDTAAQALIKVSVL
jgi:Ca2+-binding RTX toxin-like protein